MTVLIVDDEQLYCLSVTEVLTEAGYKVHCEYDGNKGIEAAQHLNLTGAIIDVGLPGSSGVDVPRAVRDRHPSIPIVLCTGFDKLAFSDLATELQLYLLEKPVEDAALIRVLSQRALEPLVESSHEWTAK